MSPVGRKLSRTMVSQRIALAYLAPDIIESVLNGNQPRSMQFGTFRSFSSSDIWQAQREVLAVR